MALRFPYHFRFTLKPDVDVHLTDKCSTVPDWKRNGTLIMEPPNDDPRDLPAWRECGSMRQEKDDREIPRYVWLAPVGFDSLD